MNKFFEELFFNPKWYHYFWILFFLPISIVYGLIMLLRRVLTKKKRFAIPIVSVGNLIVGGSGKTPMIIALAKEFKEIAIVSRGYGRASKGLFKVSNNGKILCDVKISGDEAMLLALNLPNSSIYVSEKREDAINLAIKEGAKTIFLDDGFNRVNIDKFEILLEPKKIKNYLPFPSGAFREFYFTKYFADINLKEERDFKRKVKIKNKTEKMLLITAISNPKRLNQFLPKETIGKIYLPDHSYFSKQEIEELLRKYTPTSILCTQKDEVKLKDMGFDLSVMILEIEIISSIF